MNLASILDGHPDDAPALVSRGQVTTYGELRSQVAALRGGLTGLGIMAGDRVAIACANNWFFAVSYFAVLGIGAVAVPLNPASPTAEIETELKAVAARVIIAGPAAKDAVNGLDRAQVGVDAVIAPEGSGVEDATALESLLDGAGFPMADRRPDDLAVLVFTSGTAGSPKAAMLTHGNLLSNIEQGQRLPARRLEPSDVAFGVLPLFHIFGLNVVLGLTLAAGGSVVLVERFDPAAALEAIVERGCTVVLGAPPMFAAWASLPGAPGDAFAKVRLALTGAAALAPEVASAFEERFGIPLRQGYGLTEASPVVTSSVSDGAPKPGSIGVPLPGIDLKLIDDEGEEALAGDSGEIWVKGPNVFAGYWEDPEATAAALTDDGWLRTGDIAVVDDDGHLFLVDRAKDLIIVSGFNVYPAEVEEALAQHPGVEQVAVVGVPHPHSGETVRAYVVPVSGRHVEEDQLIDFCSERLARYKCPTKITFVESLPMGLAGKLLRRALRTTTPV